MNVETLVGNTKELNLEFVRGDTFAFSFTIKDFTADLDKVFLTCKENPDDETYKFQKKLNTGITKTETGKYKVQIENTDTENLEVGFKYGYDIQINYGSVKNTIIKGNIILLQDYTRNSDED